MKVLILVFLLSLIHLGWCGPTPKRSQDHKGVTMVTEPTDDLPQFIFPGTKYCGSGNISTGLTDLGELVELDTCCRDHDMCPDDILPGETKYNITNDTPTTISHCDCDEDFRVCLKTMTCLESIQVGSFFFSSGLFQCHAIEYPVKKCISRAGNLAQACQEYTFDKNAKKVHQLLDLKVF